MLIIKVYKKISKGGKNLMNWEKYSYNYVYTLGEVAFASKNIQIINVPFSQSSSETFIIHMCLKQRSIFWPNNEHLHSTEKITGA